MTDHLIVADIGGTNCRFALFALEPALQLLASTWHATEGLHSLDDVLQAYQLSGSAFPLSDATALVVAIAGPVTHPLRGHTTNARLSISLEHIRERHGVRHAWLLNDFQAQAYACLTEPGHTADTILTATRSALAAATAIGVVGAGTGLGTASLVIERDRLWRALAAEGGHTTFPFVGRDEADFESFIREKKQLPFVRGDDVLTGSGLTLLHQFLTGDRLDAHDVALCALQEESPTLRWFARFYGRISRNWVLTTMSGGGLFIAGGIAAKNRLVVGHDSFTREFYNSPTHGELLQGVHVRLMTDENSGLWGAAWFGKQELDYART